MIEYNKDENLLIMNKVNLPRPLDYDNDVLSDIKDAYDTYKETTVIDDLQYFFDSLAKKYNLYKNKNLERNRITVAVQNIEKKTRNDSRDLYAPKKSYYSIECNLYQGEVNAPIARDDDEVVDPSKGRDYLLGPKELLQLPYMDSRGVMTIENSTKVLVNALQAAEGVSYGRKDHEINIQLGARNIKFSIDKSGKFSMRTAKKKKCYIDDVIYGCFAIEGKTDEESFKEFSTLHNASIIRNSTITNKYTTTSGLSVAKKVLTDLYVNDAYRLNTLARNELNTACQLDRAIGETLSRDVYGMRGNIIALRGKTITKEMVKEFKQNRITTIYVRHLPDLAGTTPYNVKLINLIAHGTHINSYIRNNIGSEYGYFVNQDIVNNVTMEGLSNQSDALSLFMTPGMVGQDSGRLTREQVEALYNVYIGLENACDELRNKTNLTPEEEALLSTYMSGIQESIRIQRVHSRITVPLDVEVKTNNTFWGPDVDSRFDKDWYVLTETGTLIKQSEDTREFTYTVADKVIQPFNGKYLNVYDIMAIYSMLGFYALEPESRILYDRDEMLLKKVKTVNMVFSECYRKAVDIVLKSTYAYKGLINFDGARARIDIDSLNSACYAVQKTFYSQLIKDKYVATADTKNPAATLAQVCNITTVVQSSKAVSDEQRLLSFAYASRICPYETPASGKIGLVNHKAMGCHISKDGILKAAYRSIDKSGSVYKVSNQVRWMTVKEACKYNISDLLSLQYIDDTNGTFRNSPVMAMVPNESKHGEAMVVETIDSYAVDYVFATPEATVSTTAMLIPFLGSDDTARISFGLSMQKQAIYCLENEKPRVMTTMYKDILKYNDYYEIRAERNGQVVAIDDSSITVEYDTQVDTSKTELPGTYVMCPALRSLKGIVRKKQGLSLISKYVASKAGGIEAIAEFPCMISGFVPEDAEDGVRVKVLIKPCALDSINKKYDSELVVKRGLKAGDVIREGEIIFPIEIIREVREHHTIDDDVTVEPQDNQLPYDCTITCCVPTDEQGKHLVIFEPIQKVYREKERIPCHTVEINQSDCVFMHYDKVVNDTFKAGDILAHASVVKDGIYSPARNAIVCYMPTGYNYEDAVDMSQDCARHYTAIMAHKQKVSAKDTRDFAQINSGYISEGAQIFTGATSKHNKAHNVNGYFLNTILSTENRGSEIKYADARLLAFNNQREGDKMAGRHGNKGVTARICRNSEMPMFMNGRIPDICLNPCGVPSRMNIGQNLEAHLGFIATMLDVYIVSNPFNGASREDIALLMKYVHALANEDNVDNWKAITASYGLPASLCNKAVKNYDYIHDWKGAFNDDGTAYMWDPISQKQLANPIAFGVAYFLKLEQEADEKIHARDGMDTSAYVDATQQPSQSRAKGGGQRNGEMELVTLGAYGAVGILHESMHEKADDVGARFNFTRQMFGINDGFEANERECVPVANDMLRYLLEAIGVAMDTTNITEEEAKYIKPITRSVSDNRYVYNHTDVKESTSFAKVNAIEQADKQFDSLNLDGFLDSLSDT